MAIFGQVNKPGKARRDTPAMTPRGREIAQTRRAEIQVVHGPEPIGAGIAAAVFGSALPSSPMSRGRDVSFATGAGITGRASGRTGALQNWRAIANPVANPTSRALGAQAGPSSQPAYPSTGSAATPSPIHDALLRSSQLQQRW